MTEPNVILCLLCKQSFDRDTEGTDSYLTHRKTCNRTTEHPSNPRRPA